jgi:hypothetical protein
VCFDWSKILRPIRILERPGRKRKKFAPAGEGEVRQAKVNAKTYNEDSSEDEETAPKHVRSDNSENKYEMDEEQRDEGKRKIWMRNKLEIILTRERTNQNRKRSVQMRTFRLFRPDDLKD